MLSENKIISALQTTASGEFIGDDAAILPHATINNRYVISKDLLIEDVHFRTSYFTADDLAHKALHVNLSDIAAMGAKPLYILCGIAIPNCAQDYAINFLNALTIMCENIGVILIGGDTTASPNNILISITAIGQTPKCNIKYRSTAKSGDIICIAGNIGFAHLGFLSLEQAKTIDAKYTNSFLRPEAKIKEGIWLGSKLSVTSMMDVSDGLYIDLQRLSLRAKKQAAIDINFLQNHLTPEISLQIALEGGEDYGLLMTIDKCLFADLSQQFTQTFGYDLKVIGHMTDGAGVVCNQDNQPVNIAVNPFTHFGEKL